MVLTSWKKRFYKTLGTWVLILRKTVTKACRHCTCLLLHPGAVMGKWSAGFVGMLQNTESGTDTVHTKWHHQKLQTENAVGIGTFTHRWTSVCLVSIERKEKMFLTLRFPVGQQSRAIAGVSLTDESPGGGQSDTFCSVCLPQAIVVTSCCGRDSHC